MPPKSSKRRNIDIELHRPAKYGPTTTTDRRHTHYEPGRAPEHSVTSFPVFPEDETNDFVSMSVDHGNDNVPDLLPPDNESDDDDEDLGLQALGLGDSALVPKAVAKKRTQAVSHVFVLVFAILNMSAQGSSVVDVGSIH